MSRFTTRPGTAARVGTVARRVMVTLYVSAACLGSLVVPPGAALVEAAVAAALGATLCLSVHRSFTESWPGAATLRTWATVSFLAPLYVHGVRALDDLGLVVTLAIVPLALVRLREAIRDEARTGTAPLAEALVADGAADSTSLAALVAGLPLEALLDEWRDVGGGRPGDEAAEARRLRDAIVDEFRRRDAAGTRRWLEAGAAEPPERYLRPDGGG